MSEDYRYNSDLYHAMCKQLWSVVSPDGKKSCAELAVDEIDRLRASLASAESRLAIAVGALENIRDEGDLHSHLQAEEALRQVRSKR